MNEDLQKQLAESIKGFTETLGSAADTTVNFAKDQVPDIIHQYVMWGIASNTLFLLACLTSVGAFVWAFFKLKKYKGIDIEFFVALGGALWFLPSLIGAYYAVYNLLLITISPKVWLIQEAARLLK